MDDSSSFFSPLLPEANAISIQSEKAATSFLVYVVYGQWMESYLAKTDQTGKIPIIYLF